MASLPVAGGRRIAHNTGSLFLSRVVVAGASLAALPVLYDGLGPRGFGVWALLGVLVALVSLADLGLGTAQIREVARAHDAAGCRRARAALGLGMLCSVGLGLLALLGTLVCWPVLARLFHVGDLAHEARDGALWLMLGVLLDQISLPWRSMLAGTQRYTAIAWTTAATALLGAVFAVLVVRLGGGLAALGASTAVTSAIRAAVLMTTAHRGIGWLTPRVRGIRRADVRAAARYGLPVQVTRATGVVNSELGRLVVGGSFGPAQVAGFDLGSRLLSVLRLPPDLLFTVLFPFAVSGVARHGRDWLDNFYLTTTRYVVAFAGPCAAALVVCADPLIRCWIGQPVPWAAATVAILAPSYALGLTAGAATLVTRVEGRPDRETWYLLLALALNLALVPPLLRLCGPLGAALSTAIAITVSSGYFAVWFHRATGRPLVGLLRAIRPGVVAAFVAGVGGGLAAPYLPEFAGRTGAGLTVLCRGGAVLLIAAVVLVATGLVGGAERTWLTALWRRWAQYGRSLLTRQPAAPVGGGVPDATIRKDVP
ncbi:lipopolysaccharide biosynthesis protein [Plantactinospora solaniradicis]|uniref:Lipopolysaccharide biosynthesis protein n=1 Tax=Plantactinospora solaniradicis TaxID=1723736 RepID=A0ABW1KAK8_9ACTN